LNKRNPDLVGPGVRKIPQRSERNLKKSIVKKLQLRKIPQMSVREIPQRRKKKLSKSITTKLEVREIPQQ